MGLFKPAWMSDNEEKALKAVEKEKNLSKLYKIAKNASDLVVRLLAAEKLPDKTLARTIYADIENNIYACSQRLLAVEKLTDQGMLAYVAKNTIDYRACLAAVDKLTDQHFLADVVKSGALPQALLRAAEKLADQTIAQERYAALAKNFEPDVRLEAINRLTDQKVLAYVAKNDHNSYVRVAAEKRLQATRDGTVQNDNR